MMRAAARKRSRTEPREEERSRAEPRTEEPRDDDSPLGGTGERQPKALFLCFKHLGACMHKPCVLGALAEIRRCALMKLPDDREVLQQGLEQLGGLMASAFMTPEVMERAARAVSAIICNDEPACERALSLDIPRTLCRYIQALAARGKEGMNAAPLSFCATCQFFPVSSSSSHRATFLPPDWGSGPEDHCGALAGAATCLTALIMTSERAVGLLAAEPSILGPLVARVGSAHDELSTACCWFLYQLASRRQELLPAVVDAGAVGRVLATLADPAFPAPSKGIVLWVAQIMAMHSDAVKQELVDKGILQHLLELVLVEDVPAASAAMWVVGTLCAGMATIRAQAVERHNLHMVLYTKVMLATGVGDLKHQAVYALLNVTQGHPRAPADLAAAGIFAALVDMLPEERGTVHVVEKVLRLLNALCDRHHLDNRAALLATPHCLTKLKFLLQCNSSSIRGLACALVRTVVHDNAANQDLVAAAGFLPLLKATFRHPDRFCREQAVAACFNAIAKNAASKALLRQLEPCQDLVAAVCALDGTTSKDMYLVCVLVLYCVANGDPGVTAMLAARDDLRDALLRLANPACQLENLRVHSGLLLRLLWPDLFNFAARVEPAALAMLAYAHAHTPAAEERCVVCHGDADEAPWSRLPCDHSFHAECLRRWFKKGRATCPMCRHDVMAWFHQQLAQNHGLLSPASCPVAAAQTVSSAAAGAV